MKLFFSYFNEGRGGAQIRDMDGSHSSSFFIKPPLLSLLIHISTAKNISVVIVNVL